MHQHIRHRIYFLLKGVGSVEVQRIFLGTFTIQSCVNIVKGKLAQWIHKFGS